ncbi:hypothetical protein [Rhizobium sp. RU36D]|uniref:hypothetical protein n=1 Tax=Rhizobium sp. RU36D TaxID=1907415 RepID=UPI0015C43227|nr:hypothetical protein [Rhizobium sp. RU36D]
MPDEHETTRHIKSIAPKPGPFKSLRTAKDDSQKRILGEAGTNAGRRRFYSEPEA